MYDIIGAGFGFGAQLIECAFGPEALFAQGLLEFLEKKNILCKGELLFPERRVGEKRVSFQEALPILQDFAKQLAEFVYLAMKSKDFPIVLGGDHSIAVGTWNGVYRHLQAPFGLIWIDAHMDAHTTETSPSKAWHGMPAAALLGFGEPKLSQLAGPAPILAPENLCFVGPRSFEKEEARLLEELHVKVFSSKEILMRGMEVVMQEAIDHVLKKGAVFGVSCDLDILDPTECPGVGSPEKNGLPFAELRKGLRILKEHPAFIAFELVEYNPLRDVEGRTKKICFEILLDIMSHK